MLHQRLLALALSLSLAVADNANKVTFIKAFADSQQKPTNLIVWRNCFDQSEKLELFRSNYHPTMLNSQETLSESDFGENPQHFLFVVDLSCAESPEGIVAKIDAMLFSHPYRWLIFINSGDKVHESIRALPDSDVVSAEADNDGGFALKQFYRVDESSTEIIHEHYGWWRRESGIADERQIKVISRRRKDLRGKVMTSSYVHLNKDSRNHLTDFKDKHIDAVMKVNYLIVNFVLDGLNVTRKELFQSTWGYFNPKTKKWSGMVGDVVHKGADIGGTPLFIVEDRFKYLDYTLLNTPTKGKFIFRAPQLSAVSNIYTLPFRPSVWFSCLILVVASTILLHLTSQTESLIVDGKAINQQKRFTDSILSTVAALCQMDPSLQSKITSSRIIMFFIFLAFSFLYAAYTANIVSLLQSPSKSIRNMRDLYNSKIYLAIDDTPPTRHYHSLANIDGEFERLVHETKIAPKGQKDHFVKINEGIANVRKGLYAIMVEELAGYKHIEDTFYEHEKCDIMAIEYLRFADPYVALKKRSPYREILKVNLVRAMEVGIQRRTFSKIYTKKPVCVNRQNFQSISIDDALPAFLLLPYGIVLSFTLLLAERFLRLIGFRLKFCLKI